MKEFEFNNKTVAMKLVPHEERRLEDDFKPDLIGIEAWQLKDILIDELSVNLQINFTDPIQIS